MFGLKVAILTLVTLAGASATYYRNDCPNKWFTAQFVSIADVVVPSSLLLPSTQLIDPDLGFLRDIMLFSEDEIESATQDAIAFFDARYGLDFSLSAPDGLGRRQFKNATFFPYVFPPEVRYTINFNQWIINGRTSNWCFENRDGGFIVAFDGAEKLFGSYGGEEGIPISPGDLLLYGFYNLPVYEQQPIVIQYQSGTPFRFEPVDGFGVINCELHHSALGEGVAQGVFKVTETGEDGMVHVSIRNLFTFPGHPGLSG